MLTINHSAIPLGSHILVAVSGGADSVALLRTLHAGMKAKRWQLTVAHLDHGIRGKSSLEDARFVRTLTQQLKIPCVIGRVKVPELARRTGVSLEMAARQARYAFLVRTARKVGAGLIATAHTADDQVETLLLKFLRGAGRAGLSGIAPATALSGMGLIRPLLGVTRAEIEAMLRAHNWAWREDETNTDTVFLRNRVRHELIPLLERDFNPGLRQTLQRTREVFSAEDEWMDDLARDILKECLGPAKPLGENLRGDRLSAFPLAARRRVIRLWLFGQGVPEEALAFEAVSRVDHLAAQSAGSGRVELPGGWKVLRHYGVLRMEPPSHTEAQWGPVKLMVPGKTVIPRLGVTVIITLDSGVVKDKGAGPGKLPAKATLNAAMWAKRELWIRGVKAGDRMIPFGMKGSQKIQDILVNAKVPRSERSGVPVIECEGEILWVPGYRIAARWAIAQPDGRNLQMSLLQNPAGDTEVVPPYCKTGRFHHLLEGRAPSRPSSLEVLQRL